MINSVAEYILSEKEFSKKIEIMNYIKRKTGIFFDNSIIFKTLIVKLFIETMEINVDKIY